jgi:hypothetical protein
MLFRHFSALLPQHQINRIFLPVCVATNATHSSDFLSFAKYTAQHLDRPPCSNELAVGCLRSRKERSSQRKVLKSRRQAAQSAVVHQL